MTQDYAGFFEQTSGGGGNGAPSFDFGGQGPEGIGRVVHGEIVDIYDTVVTEMDPPHDKKLDKNGKEIPQRNVTLQTELRNWAGAKAPGKDDQGNPLPASEDTGLRRVYLRYKAARRVGDAIRAAGAEFSDFQPNVGAQLYMKRIQNDGRMHDFEVAFKKGDKPVQSHDVFGGSAAPADASTPPWEAAPAATQEAAPTTSNPWADAAATSTDEPPF